MAVLLCTTHTHFGSTTTRVYDTTNCGLCRSPPHRHGSSRKPQTPAHTGPQAAWGRPDSSQKRPSQSWTETAPTPGNTGNRTCVPEYGHPVPLWPLPRSRWFHTQPGPQTLSIHSQKGGSLGSVPGGRSWKRQDGPHLRASGIRRKDVTAVLKKTKPRF